MDAVSLLNKHIDIRRVLEYYSFQKMRDDKGMIRCACAIHGGDNPSGFVANPDNGLWYCHTGGCGGGDAYTLVQKMENVDFIRAVQRVASIMDVSIADLQIVERREAYVNELREWMRIMRKVEAPPALPFEMPKDVKEVKSYRGFLEETLGHFALGYVETFEAERKDGSPYQLHKRLTVPIHNEHGCTIGVSLRRTRAQDNPKWSHQPLGLKTSDMLYNYDLVKYEPSIAVVEGIFDVWAYYEIGVPAVCTYGAHLSDNQYKMLLRTGADIVLSYDGDDAGRKATEHAKKMLRNKANLSIVQFANGQDPESIPREELKERYDARKQV